MFNLDQLINQHTESKPITVDKYNRWQKEYVFDALKGILPGQSFCERFDIQDFRIQYERDWDKCNRLIRREWLARS